MSAELEKFFIITPPGFETETRRELEEVWPFLLDASSRPQADALPELTISEGGIEFEAEFAVGLQLNFFLKTASRILMRLDEFRVRDFPKLHERLKKLNLDSWLPPGPLDLRISARASRLGHEKRILETAVSAWKRKVAEKDADAFRVHIRLDDDLCTVSLDSTGEHLHRRGKAGEVGEAPLRETLAAFLVRRLIAEEPPAVLREITLVDPMAGSGHLVSEAAALWSGGFERPYSFQQWKRGPKLFKQAGFAGNYRLVAKQPFGGIAAADVDPKMVQVLKRNLGRGLFGDQADVQAADLFAGEVVNSQEVRTWLVTNPPYGLRLAAPPPQKILDRLLEKYRPERIGILLPEDQSRSLRWPDEYVRVNESPVKNGGLPCRFTVRERRVSSGE